MSSSPSLMLAGTDAAGGVVDVMEPPYPHRAGPTAPTAEPGVLGGRAASAASDQSRPRPEHRWSSSERQRAISRDHAGTPVVEQRAPTSDQSRPRPYAGR